MYRFDPRWGFRSALQKYYALFPQHFTKRVTREGVWMPFSDVAKALGLKQAGSAQELVSGKAATPSGRGWRVSLRPQEAKVLCLRQKPE